MKPVALVLAGEGAVFAEERLEQGRPVAVVPSSFLPLGLVKEDAKCRVLRCAKHRFVRLALRTVSLFHWESDSFGCLTDLRFSGGRIDELSGRAIHQPTLRRGRGLSNRNSGRPSAASAG